MGFAESKQVMAQGVFNNVDLLGKVLSRQIHCAVRHCQYAYENDKRVFECACGKTFAEFAIKGAMQAHDFSDIIKHHEEKEG